MYKICKFNYNLYTLKVASKIHISNHSFHAIPTDNDKGIFYPVFSNSGSNLTQNFNHNT
jgi:hypothetical protein